MGHGPDKVAIAEAKGLRHVSGDASAQGGAMPAWMMFLLATASGLAAANVYYSQPLVGPISETLHIPASRAGFVVTMTQIGYGIGLIFLVPLADLLENRRLVVAVLALGATALLAAGLATTPAMFLSAALVIGIGSVAVQMLVLYGAHLADDSNRGRVVGNITGGLMLGIMLARPVASGIAALSSWRAVFVVAAVLIALLAAALWRILPQRMPSVRLGYGKLLTSLVGLARGEPELQRRTIYQAFLFAAFSLFWTTVPLVLATEFRLSQAGIALFALSGAAGAVAAPIAGRMSDHGYGAPATLIAMLLAAGAFLITHIGGLGSGLALACLVIAAIALDFGVQTSGVIGQRTILTLRPEARSRLNGLFIASFFVAGAAGSALGGWAYAYGGWPLASWIGFALPVAALICFSTERNRED